CAFPGEAGRDGPRIAAAHVLRERAMGTHLRRAEAAADQVLPAHELLRHRLQPVARWPTSSARLVPRQPRQRSSGPGGAEHESDVRFERTRGIAMKVVVKIGGAALEDKKLVQRFARAVAEFCREGHQLVVVHGGGVMLSRTMKRLGHESTF